MKVQIPHCLSVALPDRHWYVLRVRGGMADAVFADLSSLGYEAYLPRRRVDKFNRRQRVLAEWSEPAFSNYLFVAHPRRGTHADDWSEVLGTKGVIERLKGAVGPLIVPTAVIEVIMRMEFESVYDDTERGRRFRGESERDKLEAKFQPGKLFVIAEGPFASFMAEVEGLTPDGRVSALMNIFGRMSRTELSPDQLQETAA